MSGVKGRSGGHNRLPTVVKALAGTLKPSRVNPDEPVIPALTEIPKAPSYLSAMAKRFWTRTAGVLVEMGVLTEADLPGLEAYCSVYARWRDAEAHLKKSTTIMGGATGTVEMLSVYSRVSRECLKEMKSWMVEFGLTPSSRSRIRVEKKAAPAPSDGEDWFNDRRN